jgi:hypothetical protein
MQYSFVMHSRTFPKFNPLAAHIRRWRWIGLVFLILAGFTGPAAAIEPHDTDYPGKVTDKAFAALLSMPSAAPTEGVWNFPRPDDFTPGDEAALIRYLTVQVQAGAEINARRHVGTLLHHAIRAGLTTTANWLLDHGADPFLEVVYSGSNALTLAHHYGHEALAARLRDEFHVPEAPPPPVPPPPPTPDQIALALAQGDPGALSLARQTLMDASYADPQGATALQDRGAQARKRWRRLETQLTPTQLAQILDHEVYFPAYARHLRFEPDRLAQALARLPDALIQRWGGRAVDWLASPYPLGQTGPEARAALRALWERVDAPIDYAATRALAGRLAPDLWDALFASGYSDHDAESALGCMLAGMPVADMIAYWPHLVRQFPNIVAVAPRMLLSSQRLRDRRQCNGNDILPKLAFVSAQGPARPVTGLMRSDTGYGYAGTIAARIIAPYLPDSDAVARTPPRLVDAPAPCHFTLNDTWFNALKDDPVLEEIGSDWGGRVRMTHVQLLALPGRDDCGVLVSGHRMWIEEYFSGAMDGFEGVSHEPWASCPDPVEQNELWLEADGKIRRLPTEVGQDYSEAWLARVRDSETGRILFLQVGETNGRCGGPPRIPPIYAWDDTDGRPALRRINDADLEEALHAACHEDQYTVSCRGINLLSPGVQADLATRARDPLTARPDRMPVDIATFITAARPAQHAAYLAAVLALDEAALARFDAQGMPARWRADAFNAFLASDLTAAQRRQRMTRLLRDDATLAGTLGLIPFEVLLDQLTLDDWSRLLKQLGTPVWMQPMGRYFLDRTAAAERGHTTLACMIDHANGWICGETIDVDEPR